MHAIAHFILKNNPRAKILYVSSETFTNELIDAIRNKTTLQPQNSGKNTAIMMFFSLMISNLL